MEAVFETGSFGTGQQSKNSDYDLIVVFTQNQKHIKSAFTWIDDLFADIYFFDHSDLQRIDSANSISANSMDGILVSWVSKGSIIFDKDGLTTKLKNDSKLSSKIKIEEQEKLQFWKKINYEYIANMRYYSASDDTVYQEALDLRLLHSVVQLINGFFVFRNLPWQGEKYAYAYLKENGGEFFSSYVSFLNSRNTMERFECYKKMVGMVFTESYTLWNKNMAIVTNDKEIRMVEESDFLNSLQS